jgi:hypothetical protein
MNRRELIFALLALVLGFGAGFATNASLEGTAGEDSDSEETSRIADDRILYQLTLDQAEEWLLSLHEADSEEATALTERFASLADYDGTNTLQILGRPEDIGPVDSVLGQAYAAASDQEFSDVEGLDIDEGDDSLQVIIGEWSDPYSLDGGPVFRFYLKVPPSLNDNLPKDWADNPDIALDKELETTIFWKSLRGIPKLES